MWPKDLRKIKMVDLAKLAHLAMRAQENAVVEEFNKNMNIGVEQVEIVETVIEYPNGPRNSGDKAIADDYVHAASMNQMINFKLCNLIDNIDMWGRERQLERKHGCTAKAQFKKLREEIDEWEAAILAGNEIEMVDGGGDALTVMIQIMRLTEVPMIEHLERAYSQIRYRKGKMIDGIFVKEEEK